MPYRSLAGLGDDEEDSGTDWGDVVSTIANDVTKIASPILKGRYSTPTVSPGTYFATRPDGSTVAYGQIPGSPLNLPGTSSLTGSSSSLLIFAGIGLLAVLLVAKK